MLTNLCQELRNWFVNAPHDKHFGTFEIIGGRLMPSDFIKDNQYFRIVGSTFNDGVHQYPPKDLQDETFTGAIWLMSVPKDVLNLADDIKKFNDEVVELGLLDKGYASESFGGYSYSLYSSAPVHLQEKEKLILRGKSRWRKI